MKKIKVLFTAYECAPFFKMGGLGDVAGSLPKALMKLGADIRVVLPYYREIKKRKDVELVKKNEVVEYGGSKIKINILRSYLPGSKVPIYFIDNKEWFGVKDIFDKNNRERFVLFSYLVAQLPSILEWNPNVIHANDWHTGMTNIFSKGNIKSLYTIHNLAYKGSAQIGTLEKFGLAEDDFSGLGKERKVNVMKEAILQSNIVNTVSPTYAKEILTKEYGAGMEKEINIRKKDLYGIVNGIDYNTFNPKKDKNIFKKYDLKSLSGKVDNKKYLQEMSGLEINENIPLISMISRLVGQKGFELLEKVFDELMSEDLQLVILGTGEKKYEEFFGKMNKKYRGKFKAHLTFSAPLASQIYASSDIFLMPSKYEPCGLGQLIAMKYGSVPLVRETGGLKDTVKKGKTGFNFKNYDVQEMVEAIKDTLGVYGNQKKWQSIVTGCMQQDFSWESSAKEYLKLYKKLS